MKLTIFTLVINNLIQKLKLFSPPSSPVTALPKGFGLFEEKAAEGT